MIRFVLWDSNRNRRSGLEKSCPERIGRTERSGCSNGCRETAAAQPDADKCGKDSLPSIGRRESAASSSIRTRQHSAEAALPERDGRGTQTRIGGELEKPDRRVSRYSRRHRGRSDTESCVVPGVLPGGGFGRHSLGQACSGALHHHISKQRAAQNVGGAGGHLVATRRAATMNDH